MQVTARWQAGFTVIEILIVMILMGLIAALGFPRLRDAVQKQNVRSARVAMGTLAAKARAAAVQRGCRSVLFVTTGTNGRAWVTTCKPTGVGRDTVGPVELLGARYGVNITTTRDSVQYGPRGLALDFVTTIVRFQSSVARDSIVINPLGKVVR